MRYFAWPEKTRRVIRRSHCRINVTGQPRQIPSPTKSIVISTTIMKFRQTFSLYAKTERTICLENSRLNRRTQKRKASQTISFVEAGVRASNARTLNGFSSFLRTQQKWTLYLFFRIQRLIWYTWYLGTGEHDRSEHSTASYASSAYHALIKRPSLSISTAFFRRARKRKERRVMCRTPSQWMLHRPKSERRASRVSARRARRIVVER